ncbi:MAG: DUF4145 domain-containing protein [Paludibacteraceae bacterium]|nr:DUF4145 domain-containing protein [Paludibacteraceae bacterium]
MAKTYVKPSKELVKYTCPHCNTLSQVDRSQHNFPSDEYVEYHDIRAVTRVRNRLTIHRCQCCGKKIIWIDDNYIYPDIVPEEANPDMPESVKQLYNEAALIANKSPRAACALLRLAIDRLCNELGEKDSSIDKNIGALVKRGLSQEVQQALDIVRVVGNKAVHPGQIAFDVDNVETATILMSLLNMIVTRMITEPQKIGSLFKSLPESVKKSIEKRDK